MAVNRASNSRFIFRDSVRDSTTGTVVAARSDARRRADISNFTATLQFCPALLSRCHRATSTIIERIRNGGYELWKRSSAFWDAIWPAGRGSGGWVSLRELADFLTGLFLK